MRFLIIISIIFLFELLIRNVIKKKVNTFFQSFIPKQEGEEKKDEVIYNKDDVVVLRGEGKKEKGEGKKEKGEGKKE